jgi:hypothetical protein
MQCSFTCIMLMCLYIVITLLILQELVTYSAQQSKNTTCTATTAPTEVEVESADQPAATSHSEPCTSIMASTDDQLNDIAGNADDDVVSNVASYISGDEQEGASYGLTISADKHGLYSNTYSKSPTAAPTGAATGTAAAPTDDDVSQTRRVEVTGTEPATLEVEFADHLTTLGQTEHNVAAKLSTDEQCDGITAADVAIDVADDASTGESPLAVGSTEPVEAVLVLEQQQQQVLETAKVSI